MKNEKKKNRSFSFYLSILLGLTSFVFIILNYSNEKALDASQIELNAARDSLTIYILRNNKLQFENDYYKNHSLEK